MSLLSLTYNSQVIIVVQSPMYIFVGVWDFPWDIDFMVEKKNSQSVLNKKGIKDELIDFIEDSGRI